MKKYLFPLVFLLGNILHISFLRLNEVLKISDSFSYLQMAHYFKQFSLDGLGNGWFGFLYSLPIAFVDSFVHNEMISAFLINIILFNILVWVCYILGKNYLSFQYNLLFIASLFLSPILLNFNIWILSENLYIPLFLILFVWVLRYKDLPSAWNSLFLGMMIALLYFTRSEAFIYMGSLWLILFGMFASQRISFWKFLGNGILIVGSFFILISPYIFYLHSFTWEWGLTNKGSANLRQAELRGISKMDDDGFEQAVWELTSDHHHLIAWFAGGLKYDTPQIENNFKNYLLENPEKVLQRIGENQAKLYTHNLPRVILGNAFDLYKVEGNTYFSHNIWFLSIVLIPLALWVWWIFSLLKKWEYFLVGSFLSFFLVGSLFFTLFFVLDRYFVIFVPIFLFFIVYGLEHFGKHLKISIEWGKYLLFSGIILGIFALGTLSYYNTFKWEDDLYEVKKMAWIWLQNSDPKENLKVMERFPVVTYYAWSWERWLTPYTSQLESLIEYAKYNDIDYLVVDSIDFYRYRPDLRFLFDESDKKYPWIKKIQEFEKNGEKVILYQIEK